MNPRIVCAANSYQTGEVVIGLRHWDGFMVAQIQAKCLDGLKERQGFVDQRGIFYTRTDAWKIAEANGQIVRRVGGDEADGGTLYSENLY